MWATLAASATLGLTMLAFAGPAHAGAISGVAGGKLPSKVANRISKSAGVPTAKATTPRVSAPSTSTPASALPQGSSTSGATPPKSAAGAPGVATTSSVPASTPSTPASGVSPATTVPTPATGSTSPTGTGTAQSSTGGPARQAATSKARGLSSGAIAAAIVAALLILLCAVWAFARWTAYEPPWTLTLRHSLEEAGVRLSSTWEEFADWARLGR